MKKRPEHAQGAENYYAVPPKFAAMIAAHSFPINGGIPAAPTAHSEPRLRGDFRLASWKLTPAVPSLKIRRRHTLPHLRLFGLIISDYKIAYWLCQLNVEKSQFSPSFPTIFVRPPLAG